MQRGGSGKGRKSRYDVRADKVNDGQRQIKEKFLEQRKENFKPVKPMNDLQAEYIKMCMELPVIIATGYAGTSKTYIPTCIAAEKWYTGQIDKIYLVRPAISSSKSLGFFGGSLVEKSKNWLMPIIDTLYEKLGKNVVDLAIENGDIEPIPLEVIKGRSLKNCFIICDEAEDLNVPEFIKIVTRGGNNSTLVLAGDILQSDLKENNGLQLAIELYGENPELPWGFIDFNRPSDIVRSESVKKVILALRRKGLM
jgi:phosphate starvation-inducible PhoH-like protein